MRCSKQKDGRRENYIAHQWEMDASETSSGWWLSMRCKAGYVRNIERDPHVRLKLREGLKYRWHAPRRICFRTTTLVSANSGWRLNRRAARGMHEQCASSERNCSLIAVDLDS